MNRRSFIERLAIGSASFMILPGAGRVWKAVRRCETLDRYYAHRDGPPCIIGDWNALPQIAIILS